MKKYILLALLIKAGFGLKAQIINSGFENLNASGSIQNWGSLFLFPATADSNGVFTGDSIVFDNQLYFSTPDAHTGLRALELRNGYNYTTAQQITGMAMLGGDTSIYGGFAPLAGLAQRPAYFSFYYKFLPAGPDTALATITVLDSNANEIGSCSIEISAAASSYSMAVKPIMYTSQEPAAFVTAQFQTAKPGSPASFGTHFLVDDVNSLATGVGQNSRSEKMFSCFPNPVRDDLNIRLNTALMQQKGRIEISDVNGKVMRELSFSGEKNLLHLDASQLDKGLYTITLISGQSRFSNSFVK